MPLVPARGRRPKAGGRQKGTPNKATLAVREALVQVDTELQSKAGRDGEVAMPPAWLRIAGNERIVVPPARL